MESITLDFDVLALQDLPESEQAATDDLGGSELRPCSWTCTWTCSWTGVTTAAS